MLNLKLKWTLSQSILSTLGFCLLVLFFFALAGGRTEAQENRSLFLMVCGRYQDDHGQLTRCGAEFDRLLKAHNYQVCAYAEEVGPCLRWLSLDELQWELIKLGYLK